MKIIVLGLTAPQGSKSFKVMRTSKSTGRSHAVMVESSAKVKPWREAVRYSALEAMKAAGIAAPIDGAIVARMVFTLPKPVSSPKRRRVYPCKTPDLSKILRATEDALTDIGAWRDDARVVEYTRLAKVYPGEDPESLPSPGVRITIGLVGEG